MPKMGPLTRDEMMLVWAAAVDKSYRGPLEDAGDGGGLEVYSQAAEQLARVSEAIDVTTQALYILPFSGQTNDPASGERKATVTLQIARTRLVNHPLYLAAGTFIVEEETTDFGPEGPQLVYPGRKYITTEDLVFHPGETGPFDVAAEAELPGWSYNNPLPDTLSKPVQVGASFTRGRATVTAPNFTAASAQTPAFGSVASVNEADTFIPEHAGQYVSFFGGANAGLIARVAFFAAQPDPVASVGSIVAFDVIHSVDGTTFAGTFVAGEILDIAGGLGFGVVFKVTYAGGKCTITFRFASGTAVALGGALLGLSSGATLTVATILASPTYVAEAPVAGVGGAQWRVLAWDGEWGLTIGNEAKPVGGKLGILDELGYERDLARSSGEEDDSYRRRVATLADVVSPNALKRALSRALGSLTWMLREVGSIDLRGWFFDGVADDAYDSGVYLITGIPIPSLGDFDFQEAALLVNADGLVAAEGYVGRIEGGGLIKTLTLILRPGARPYAGGSYHVRGLRSGAEFATLSISMPATVTERRHRRWFDYEQFRAYFIAEVPRLGIQEFGFAYDAGIANAYDASVALDGYAAGARNIYKRAYAALDQARAGGVGFHLEMAPSDFAAVITDPALLVVSVTPDSAPDVGGDAIVLKGAGFTNVTDVRIDTVAPPTPVYVINDDNTITFTTEPASAPGFVTIRIITATEEVQILFEYT